MLRSISVSQRGGWVAAIGYVLYALCMSGIACGAHTVSPDETGIQGQVLRGPASPGPQRQGQAGYVPFSATFEVQDRQGNQLTQFKSNEQGRFRVLLAPGNYTIVPDASAPILFASRKKKDVTVPAKGFAEVTLKFDTGLR